MTNSIIAIKGNHLDRQKEIFEAFSYIDSGLDKEFDSLDDIDFFLSKNYYSFSERDIALRGIWLDKNWTILLDPEMVDIFEDEALSKLSDSLNAEVLTFLIQTTSSSFGFAKYAPSTQRVFLSSDGEITKNEGLPLPEENGLKINERVFIDDIKSLAHNFGIDFEATSTQTFIAKQLGYNAGKSLLKDLDNI